MKHRHSLLITLAQERSTARAWAFRARALVTLGPCLSTVNTRSPYQPEANPGGMECLVERSVLVDRMRGALWGVLIADALSMPVHWRAFVLLLFCGPCYRWWPMLWPRKHASNLVICISKLHFVLVYLELSAAHRICGAPHDVGKQPVLLDMCVTPVSCSRQSAFLRAAVYSWLLRVCTRRYYNPRDIARDFGRLTEYAPPKKARPKRSGDPSACSVTQHDVLSCTSISLSNAFRLSYRSEVGSRPILSVPTPLLYYLQPALTALDAPVARGAGAPVQHHEPEQHGRPRPRRTGPCLPC